MSPSAWPSAARKVRTPRLDVFMEAELHLGDRKVRGVIRNVSDGGALFVCSGDPELLPGTPVLADFAVGPRQRPSWLSASVVWVRPRPDLVEDFALGLQFHDPPPHFGRTMSARWRHWSADASMEQPLRHVPGVVAGRASGRFWARTGLVTSASLWCLAMRFFDPINEWPDQSLTFRIGYRTCDVERIMVAEDRQRARFRIAGWGAQFVLEELDRRQGCVTANA